MNRTVNDMRSANEWVKSIRSDLRFGYKTFEGVGSKYYIEQTLINKDKVMVFTSHSLMDCVVYLAKVLCIEMPNVSELKK